MSREFTEGEDTQLGGLHVGQPDPTARDYDEQDTCDSTARQWMCTLRNGHGHPLHIAGDGTKIVALWRDDE